VAARLKRRLRSNRPGVRTERNAACADRPVDARFVATVDAFVLTELLRLRLPDTELPGRRRRRDPCVQDVAVVPLHVTGAGMAFDVDFRVTDMERWAKQNSAHIRNSIDGKALIVLTFTLTTERHGPRGLAGATHANHAPAHAPVADAPHVAVCRCPEQATLT
jgi:hypothetical protein